MSIIGVNDEKNIDQGKLEHIFLGTVKGDRVSGYHCYVKAGDEKVFAEAPYYPKSNRVITVNREQKLFEAIVREKNTYRIKNENNGKSTFFKLKWSRQDVVDMIDRLHCKKSYLKLYNNNQVFYDPDTGIIVVDNKASTFPLLKY